MSKLPTLYHKGKTGATVRWDIWTEGDTICTKWGQIGGALQEASKTCIGKNLGKSNETSPEEQASLEAKSMWQHKLDRKYSKTPSEAQDPVFLPMLAHDFRKVKKVQYPVLVQPKLNGLRCMAFKSDGEIVLMSRSGKHWDIEHLKESLKALPEGTVLDGELYISGQSLQEITRLAKKHRDGPGGSILLEYWVFDTFQEDNPLESCRKRLGHLKSFPKGKTGKIVTVAHKEAKNWEEVSEINSEHLEDGFEGSIIRYPEAPYELGHRSRNLLKLKPFYDAEYKVLGAKEGRGKFEGCAIFRCVTKDGQEFDACPKGTLEEKAAYLKDLKKYIGKMLTVQYNDLTEDGLPQFPVGIGFRSKEDLP